MPPRARRRGLRRRRRAPQRAVAHRVGALAAPLHRGPGAALHGRVGVAPRPAGAGAQPAADGVVGGQGLRRVRRRRADAHRHADAHRDPLAGDVLQADRQRAAQRWACASARWPASSRGCCSGSSGPLSQALLDAARALPEADAFVLSIGRGRLSMRLALRAPTGEALDPLAHAVPDRDRPRRSASPASGATRRCRRVDPALGVGPAKRAADRAVASTSGAASASGRVARRARSWRSRCGAPRPARRRSAACATARSSRRAESPR